MNELAFRSVQQRVDMYLNTASDRFAEHNYSDFYEVLLLAYREVKPFSKPEDIESLQSIDKVKNECIRQRSAKNISTFTNPMNRQRMFDMERLDQLDMEVRALIKKLGFLSIEKDDDCWGLKDD